MSHAHTRSIRSVRSAGLVLLEVLVVALAPVVAMAAPFAYVPSNGANTVSVIDTATDTVVGAIPVGVNPQHIAVHPVVPRVYVTHQTSLSVIDAEARAVVATVELGAPLAGVAVHPSGAELYVALASGAIACVDAATLVVTGTISVGGVPAGLSVHPAGDVLYVASGNVVVVATATRAVVTTVAVGPTPVRWLAVHPDGARLYALDEQSNRVVAIETTTHTVTGILPVPAPAGAAVDPTGSRLYVTSSAQHALWVVETATFSAVRSIGLGTGAQPIGVAVHPSGQRVYVANSLFDTVSVIDAVSHAVVRSIPVGRYPVALGSFVAPWDSTPGGDGACDDAEARILELETQLAGAQVTAAALEAELAALRVEVTGLRATIRSLVLRVFGRPVDVNTALAARAIAESQVTEAAASVGAAHRRVIQATRHLEAGRTALARRDYRGAVRAFDQAFEAASAVVNPRRGRMGAESTVASARQRERERLPGRGDEDGRRRRRGLREPHELVEARAERNTRPRPDEGREEILPVSAHDVPRAVLAHRAQDRARAVLHL